MPTKYFNPRSPRGLRQVCHNFRHCGNYFNPRSPRGLRQPSTEFYRFVGSFQSTQPKRAATADVQRAQVTANISIHAARVGCDNRANSAEAEKDNFNPRSPSGLRLYTGIGINYHKHFNPRSPSGLRLHL